MSVFKVQSPRAIYLPLSQLVADLDPDLFADLDWAGAVLFRGLIEGA